MNNIIEEERDEMDDLIEAPVPHGTIYIHIVFILFLV
jgi:hypothetical protein